MKTDINMFVLNIEHFFSDIRGSRHLHLKKVYFFVGHPVHNTRKKPHIGAALHHKKHQTLRISENSFSQIFQPHENLLKITQYSNVSMSTFFSFF